MGRKKTLERFEQIGSKIDPAMAEVLNACCDALGVDVYHLIQWFAYTIVKAASPMHGLDPRIQKLMTILESDVGWQNAFNIANPDDLKVAQVVLILEQQGHKGFGAVMIDKPWMGCEMQQTECVDDIMERVIDVCMHGIYRRLRKVQNELDCENISDAMLSMLDAQDAINIDDSNMAEGPQVGITTPNGRAMEFGKRTKRKKHFTPDNMPDVGRLPFDDIDIDHEAPAPKLKEWEGEWHDRG